MTDTNRKYKVLFVDDEPRVTSALKAIFRREYDVLIANSGVDALALLSKNKVDVIVSDQRMPGMLGNELLAKVSQLYPKTMRLLLTGFMDKQAIVDSINEGEVYRFINKPWNNDDMRQVVAEAALASEIPIISIADTQASAKAISDNITKNTADAALAQPSEERALLMIEQQQGVRHQIRKFCIDQNIMIYGMQNIEQAVAAATTRENIGVAVVELSQDTQSAIQTINLLKQARPELIAIALTEEYDAHTAVDLINQGQVFKYLSKPFFLKNNGKASQRYRVEKPSGVITSSLRSLFGRLTSKSQQPSSSWEP